MGASKQKKRQQNLNRNPRTVAARSLISWLNSEKIEFLPRKTFQQPSDYTFYRHLVTNVIRHKSKYEFLIVQLTGKPIKKLDSEVKACLMLGLTQLDTDSKVEDYAAINETVKLVDILKKPYLKGFINANLRSYTRERDQLEKELQNQPIEIQTSHPQFIVNRWQKQFGKKTTTAICHSNNIQPQVQLVLNPKFEPGEILEGLKKDGFDCSDTHAERLTITNPSGLFSSEWAKKGAFLVQDRSFHLLNQILVDLPKKKVLDVCSAPGGKLIHLEWSFQNEIDVLIGCEINPGRLKRLVENTAHFESKAQLILSDALSPPFKQKFDLIMLDAPCSATGTIRKHPELKWNRDQDDFARNQKIQIDMIKSCVPLLNPNGKLLYITCSLEKEENQDVVRFFSKNMPGLLKHIPIGASIIEPGLLTKEGCYQALPTHSQMGCFAALFEKYS